MPDISDRMSFHLSSDMAIFAKPAPRSANLLELPQARSTARRRRTLSPHAQMALISPKMVSAAEKHCSGYYTLLLGRRSRLPQRPTQISYFHDYTILADFFDRRHIFG
jgi:hypothetical protein